MEAILAFLILFALLIAAILLPTFILITWKAVRAEGNRQQSLTSTLYKLAIPVALFIGFLLLMIYFDDDKLEMFFLIVITESAITFLIGIPAFIVYWWKKRQARIVAGSNYSENAEYLDISETKRGIGVLIILSTLLMFVIPTPDPNSEIGETQFTSTEIAQMEQIDSTQDLTSEELANLIIQKITTDPQSGLELFKFAKALEDGDNLSQTLSLSSQNELFDKYLTLTVQASSAQENRMILQKSGTALGFLEEIGEATRKNARRSSHKKLGAILMVAGLILPNATEVYADELSDSEKSLNQVIDKLNEMNQSGIWNRISDRSMNQNQIPNQNPQNPSRNDAYIPLEVANIRYAIKPRSVRIVADVTARAQANVNWLQSPRRLVVDLQFSKLNSNVPRQIHLNSPYATQIRIAQFNADTVRIVVETMMRPAQSQIFYIEGGQFGGRLVIDLGDEFETGVPSNGIRF